MAKNTAAFFDIDGTIYRNSLMIEHFKKLIKYEVVDPSVWYGKVKHSFNEWERRLLDFDIYLLELVEIYVKQLKGINKDYIEFIANQVITLNGEKIYKYSRDRIEYHKNKGDLVFFISGSPDFLVSKMAEKYDITEYRASIYEVDSEGRFTGELQGMWDSRNKLKSVKSLIDKYDIDMSKSYAYGDTAGDYSMLKMVGKPIVINPNRELFMMLRKDPELADKIRIIVERKDMIYKLSPYIEII